VDGFKRVKVPEEPASTDRAIIAALLLAFGSSNVRELYQGGDPPSRRSTPRKTWWGTPSR
jgi:hypothetical protein